MVFQSLYNHREFYCQVLSLPKWKKTKGNTNSPDIYNSFRLKKLKVVFGEKREEKMQGKEISVYCMEKSRLGKRKQNIC